MSNSRSGFASTLMLLLTGVFTLIAANMVANPLANAIVESTTSTGFAVTFIKMFPFLMIIGGVVAMFGAAFKESRAYMAGNPSSIIMRAIVVIVAAVMLPVLLTQMTEVTTTYGKVICGATSDVTASTACTDAGISTATPPANFVVKTGEKFTAVNTFVSLLPLAYVLAMLNIAVPQLGAKAAAGLRSRF